MRNVKATVYDAYPRESKGGTPSICLECIPTDPADAADVGDTVYADLWLSEKAVEKTLARIKEVFGFDITDFAADCPKMVGREVSLSMEIEEYQGKSRWKAQFVNAPRQRREADQALTTRLNGLLRSRGIVSVANAAPPADDLPF